jgi:type IV secretory pathway VirB9-like protein
VNTPLGIQPDKLRFNYDVSGDAPFRPLVVFDDGRFTYYKLPANVQELPALFAVIDGTEYSLVNFEVRGEYIVAQRLMPTAVLKLGRSEVRVSQPVKRTFLGLTVSD